MSFIATELKKIFSVKFKHRHDSLTDQYNRLFIMKMIIACTLITGINWFKDPLDCIIPAVNSIDKSFVTTACWIQGLYVYKEMFQRTNDSAYYGIPIDVDSDGVSEKGALCSVLEKTKYNTSCFAMEKIFFLQYQWIPFFLATISLLYYTPYMVFLSVNSDLVSLNKILNEGCHDKKRIAKNYFRKYGSCRMPLKVILNMLIKIAYVATNIGTFILLDFILNGTFRYYGYRWIIWVKSENSVKFDYAGMSNHTKPGNQLFPPFGYCEIYESSKDIKHSTANKHKFVCELSQHILYQYCFAILWFLVISGTLISILGFLVQLFEYFSLLVKRCVIRNPPTKKLLNSLSLYELVYLQRIRSKDEFLYHDVIEELKRLSYI